MMRNQILKTPPSSSSLDTKVSPTEISDCDLIKAAKAGDEQAFNLILHKYSTRVYNHCCRIMGDETESYDLTQEVFLKIFHNLANYEHTYAFYTWLYRITVNTCIDHMRKKRRRVSEVSLTHADYSERWDSESEQEIADSSFCPEERMIGLQLGAQLSKALAKLPARLRAYIILKDVEGFTYSEISTIFGCSLGTVKSSLFNARQKLKALLSPDAYN